MNLSESIEHRFMPKSRLHGVFHVEVFNADGSFDREFDWENADTNAGLNSMLDVYFNSGTQITTWYLGLIDNTGFTSVAASDTMSSHTGWSESTAYSESVRQTWTSGAASGQAVTNAATVNFTANATVTVKGIFITSSNTKGGTTGTLFATATGSAQSFTSGQVMKMTYTKTLTAG